MGFIGPFSMMTVVLPTGDFNHKSVQLPTGKELAHLSPTFDGNKQPPELLSPILISSRLPDKRQRRMMMSDHLKVNFPCLMVVELALLLGF